MNLKGTQTEQNLLKSFAGESQAKNRYEFFAKQAKNDGLQKISLIFEETATQEQQHAKSFFKLLEGGEGLEITATFPAGKIGTTEENLLASLSGEFEECDELYPEFAKVADEEGFPQIATLWRNISIAERHHAERFKKLLDTLEAGEMFEVDGVVIWRCLNCGFIHEAKKAPEKCPACLHPQSYFEVLGENW